jgi:hypothetical protein
MPITKEVHFFAPQAEKYLQFNTLFHEKTVSTYPAVFFSKWLIKNLFSCRPRKQRQ